MTILQKTVNRIKEVTEIEPVYTIDDPGDYQSNIDLAINIHIE